MVQRSDDKNRSNRCPGGNGADEAAGKVYQPVTYAGAGHGFMRMGEAPGATDANRKAPADAWVRWKSLLSAGE
jgi:carboxymethylenebutenolidase